MNLQVLIYSLLYKQKKEDTFLKQALKLAEQAESYYQELEKRYHIDKSSDIVYIYRNLSVCLSAGCPVHDDMSSILKTVQQGIDWYEKKEKTS